MKNEIDGRADGDDGVRSAVALLVEDNRADVFLVREAIAAHGLPIELHVASDGEQALRFIDRAMEDARAPQPDLLLLDLNLPKRTGKEVLAYLRGQERMRHVPVVIVTSSQLPREREELMRLGANRIFTKPAGYDEFLRLGEVLREMLQAVPLI